ncbi:MAG TPA: NADH-quinone oxidoreductase subunit NuoH [Bryobacteraceae bacterium]|nr:NADH-quinone oxidoreductase subunit NuoH [Bryobacteraceae bacterium]
MNFYVITLIKLGIVMFVFMTTLAYLQWIERKVLAHIQLRLGPYRVGPHGLLQPLADVIKLLTKEGFIPGNVNLVFYLLAPFLAVTIALIAISMIPFGPRIEIGGVETYMQMTDLPVGILMILGLSSIGVYGVALAGWASNSKYALLGGLRSAAQMISYELPMAVALAAPLLMVNTLSLREMVDRQGAFYLGFIPAWTLLQMPFPQIISFITFLIAGFAETNRVPFDLPEAENELVAGFHTEYSSMSFAAFFMAEYANMVTVTSIATLLFLGGWHPLWPTEFGSWIVPVGLFVAAGAISIFHGLQPARPFDRITLPAFGVVMILAGLLFAVPMIQPYVLPLFWFTAKVGVLLFIFIWIRGTLPRFRYDQLMGFAWKFLFPLALINLLITGLAVALTS